MFGKMIRVLLLELIEINFLIFKAIAKIKFTEEIKLHFIIISIDITQVNERTI